MTPNLDSLETKFATMCREFIVRTYVPVTDVDKTLKAVTGVTPLRYGSYENVAFQSPAGTQKFRPVSGSHLGDSATVYDFSVVELVFSVPYDEKILEAVIDAIFQAHVAEEPVIYINEGWSTRAKDYSDKSNPNRFWNRPDLKNEKGW